MQNYFGYNSVCTLTCREYRANTREFAAVFYVIVMAAAEREERLLTTWLPLQMKDPSGSLYWEFFTWTVHVYVCMMGETECLPSICFF